MIEELSTKGGFNIGGNLLGHS